MITAINTITDEEKKNCKTLFGNAWLSYTKKKIIIIMPVYAVNCKPSLLIEHNIIVQSAVTSGAHRVLRFVIFSTYSEHFAHGGTECK